MRPLEDIVTDCICILDAEGRIRHWNRGAQQGMGHATEEVIGRHFALLFADEDVAAGTPDRLLRQAAATEEPVEDEGWRVRRDGSRFWGRTTITVLQGSPPDLLGFGATTRDLTQRREIEERLARSQRLESVGRLAGGVAHDFNNLLATIQGSTDLLLSRLPEADRSRRALDRISRAAAQGAVLTRQLLAFARRQLAQPRALDSQEIVSVLHRLAARVLDASIELELDLEPEPWRAEVDPTHLDQILTNLLFNARDAMPTGGRLIFSSRNRALGEADALRLELRAGRYVELGLRDTGHGMETDVLSKVLEPFFTTKELGKGTGLGLSTVFGLLKQSGGGVDIESEPGKGTCVRIYLREHVGDGEAIRDL